LLFFLVIELFLGFIFYHYRHIEEEHLKERIFLEMKNYALFFKGTTFDVDLVPSRHNQRFYELEEDTRSLYILVPLPDDTSDVLKIFYPKNRYLRQLHRIYKTLWWQFAALTFIAVVISLLFSWYVLKPLRQSLAMLETFIKDIIHDLNTPITSILINLKMMEHTEEVDSIEKSAKTIAMLHRNLDAYLKESQVRQERFSLLSAVKEQHAFFASLYDTLSWHIDIPDTVILYTDKDAFSRILYNLLHNACKYNIPGGDIRIVYKNRRLLIQNPTHGIRNPSRLFERFYKESERGLGIGLHIVKKLSSVLRIPVNLSYDETSRHITFILDVTEVTQN